jgi:two-component system NarL family response regulator
MTPHPIRVLVVDDHFMVRLGLIGALAAEQDIVVAGEASTGAAAIELFDQLLPDVTLMDGILPDIHGVDAARRIIATHPLARIIIVSINDSPADIRQALEAGVWSYVPKSSERIDIIRSIRAVASGERFMLPDVARKLAEQPHQGLLSARETEVLRLIAMGRANKEIAVELALGEATVKTHIRHILDKLKAPDRTRAVTLAIERGLIRI